MIIYHTMSIILVPKLIFVAYYNEQIGNSTGRNVRFNTQQKMD